MTLSPLMLTLRTTLVQLFLVLNTTKPTPTVEQPASPFLELYETQLRSESRSVLPGEHRIHGKVDDDMEWWEDL